MTMKRLLLLLMLLGTPLLAACGGAVAPTGNSEVASQTTSTNSGSMGEQVFVSGGSYTRVSATELQAMLRNKDFAFVNTHIPFEGNIPDTDLSIPYNEIEQNLDRLPADKDAKIVLYCRSGRMSADAAQTLVGLGYTNVWDLAGGMIAWEEAGLSLEGV
jgi:rhodanese-related sulfurtransferase